MSVERGLRLSLMSVAVNAVLAMVKLLAGLLGNSYALVADAIESMADIFSSLVVWGGLRVASRPADDNHPYGHGKAEALAALIVSIMLLGAGLGIAVQAVREILVPHHAPAPFTLIVLVGVVVVKEAFFRVARRFADRTQNAAILADAWHHRSDAITSSAAAIGISAALIGGARWAPADDWAAVAASAVILYNAWKLMGGPVRELMDAEPEAEFLGQIRSAAEGVAGVLRVEKLLARKSGVGYWVDTHVEVDPDLPVRRAHTIAHEVKDAIRDAEPRVIDVLVHVEPFELGGSEASPQRAE